MICDRLSEEGIRRFLTHPGLRVRFFPTVSSTSTVLKQLAREGAPAGLALIAEQQTAGRGRLGRSFFSPPGSGLYLSLLLRPSLPPEEAVRLTAVSAVSVAQAMEALADVRPVIKWVNDLWINGRKVCGILTEAGFEEGAARMTYLVTGIGINTRPPEEGFPPDLQSVAGAAFGETSLPDLRNRLAAGILDRLMTYAENLRDPFIFEEYKRRSFVLGKPVLILSPGKAPEPATVLDLEEDFGLRVRLESGEETVLRSGEISIRPANTSDIPAF